MGQHLRGRAHDGSGVRLRRLAVISALLALTPACSTLGEPGSFPDAYPHGGTGQFRPLDSDELGIFDGRALVLSSTAQGSAMVADGYLFYASAPLADMPLEVPEDFPASEVYWDAFDPLAIHRAPPRDGNLGFAAGPVILEASESWEGGEVFDPWVVVDDDGTARLYYAAEQGIGVAEASSVDGAFTRAGDGPLQLEASSGSPRHPSVVRGIDGAWWMYYEDGGTIRAARSDDGTSFAGMGAITLSGDDLRESPEVAIGAPGAVLVETPAGRLLIRMYFESRREDGTILPYVAGTEDGVTFERFSIPVADYTDLRFPAPVVLDDRTTLLYANAPKSSGGYQTRSLIGLVTPAGVDLAPDE